MEVKKTNEVIKDYVENFKNVIKTKIHSLDNADMSNSAKNSLLKIVYDYDVLAINKETITKKKRSQTIVPFEKRCIALCAGNRQCSRKKNPGIHICGTHIKGTPHGVIENHDEVSSTNTKLVQTWMQCIMGIDWYIDNDNNIYMTEDILNNVNNPRVYAKYVKNGEEYSFVDNDL
jgi:hypothetical protein